MSYGQRVLEQARKVRLEYFWRRQTTPGYRDAVACLSGSWLHDMKVLRVEGIPTELWEAALIGALAGIEFRDRLAHHELPWLHRAEYT